MLTTHVDANLCHDYITGRAVTGVLHFVNQMPIDWYSKKQATVETATHGAEFVAARVAKEQIQAMRLDLRYLGVQVKGATRLFGDNESVVKSGSIPHSKLNKRHQALSYHAVREAIASGTLSFAHIPGPINPADILSKHWGYQQVWPTLRPVLFWQGDTADLFDEESPGNADDPDNRKGSNTDSAFTSPNPSQVIEDPIESTIESTDETRMGSKDEHVDDEKLPRSSKSAGRVNDRSGNAHDSAGRIQGNVTEKELAASKPTKGTKEPVETVDLEHDETKDPSNKETKL